MLKKKSGITLIALVVTIMVLLILAGISISMIVSKNGVIEKSMDAKEESVYADAKEKLEIEIVGSYDGRGNVNVDSLSDNLRKNLGDIEFKYEGEEEYQELTEENKIEKLPVTVKYKTAEVEVTGEASFRGKSGKDLIPKEDYGKYVDYGLDINGNNKTTDDWRIFYTDEEGRIFLIAADYVAHTCPAIADAIKNSGMERYNDGKEDDIEEDYETYYWTEYGPKYHCNDGHNKNLNSGKAQCSFPEIFMPSGDFCSKDEHFYCSDHVGDDGTGGDISSKCASSLQCTENWKSFVEKSSNSQYAKYAIGGPTIEMLVASWNELHGDEKKLYVNNGENGYYVGDSQNNSTVTYNLGDDGATEDSLYVPHTSDSFDFDSDNKKEKCLTYWLSSPAAETSGNLALISLDLNGTFQWEGWNSGNSGLRPVICLKSGTKLVKSSLDGEKEYYYKLQ